MFICPLFGKEEHQRPEEQTSAQPRSLTRLSLLQILPKLALIRPCSLIASMSRINQGRFQRFAAVALMISALDSCVYANPCLIWSSILDYIVISSYGCIAMIVFCCISALSLWVRDG